MVDPQRVRWMVAWTVILLGASLAGCVSDDTAGPAADDGPTVADEAVVTEETGSIKGQVITLDLEPVVHQEVLLFQMGNETPYAKTKTDLQGRFTFNGVPTGDYRLRLSPKCCHERVEGVAVFAGAVTEVAYMMERIVVYVPFVEENEWSGFIACTVGTIGACRADPKDQRVVAFDVAWGLQALVVGMKWTPAGGVSTEDLRILTERNERPGSGYDYGQAQGASPLLMIIDDTTIGSEEYQFANLTQDGLRVRHTVSAAGLGFAYQQAFTIYWHEYYHAPASSEADPFPPE